MASEGLSAAPDRPTRRGLSRAEVLGTTYDMGPLERLRPGTGLACGAGEQRIAVYRTRAGRVYATDASCPHEGGCHLAEGTVGGTMVICPLHGYAFNVATGAAVGAFSPRLRTYDVHVSDDGRILVQVRGDI